MSRTSEIFSTKPQQQCRHTRKGVYIQKFSKLNGMGFLRMNKEGPKLDFLEAIEIIRSSRDPQINLLNDQIDLSLPVFSLIRLA